MRPSGKQLWGNTENTNEQFINWFEDTAAVQDRTALVFSPFDLLLRPKLTVDLSQRPHYRLCSWYLRTRTSYGSSTKFHKLNPKTWFNFTLCKLKTGTMAVFPSPRRLYSSTKGRQYWYPVWKSWGKCNDSFKELIRLDRDAPRPNIANCD